MITVVINGQSFDYPEVGDTDWGNAATVAFQSLCATTLQKSASSFTLENELDFGGSHGIKVLFISSRSNDPALSGVFRLANGELIAWRNEDNDGDNTISFDSDGDLIVNGTKVTLHGQIVNADIAAAAGIEESKLALDYSTDSLHTAIENHVTDTNNPHSVTKAQILTGDLIVNSDVDSSAAIDESKLNLDYSTSSLNTAITTHVADTNNPHSVTKAQVLTGDLIVNADVDASAAIAESKLDLDYSTSSLNTAITTHTGNTSNPHSTSVSNLTDTTITSANSGDVLSYDGSKWVNSPSTSSSLSGLSDTDITTPANGDTLVYNSVSTKWENSDELSTLDTTVSSHVGNTSNPHSTKVSNLDDASISSVADGDILVYDSNDSEWKNSDALSTLDTTVSSHVGNTSNPHSTTVSNLTDTTITSVSDKDTLLYDSNSSKWVNVENSLDNLSNTDIDSDTLTENDVMVFNDQTLKWENSQILVNHIGNASNPHLTTVAKLTDASITTPANKELLQYDYANSQWVNSSDVWNRIEVNDIAYVGTTPQGHTLDGNNNVTMLTTDNRWQVITATNGYDITLPSTGIKAGEVFVFEFTGGSSTTAFSTPFCILSGDSSSLGYAHIGYFKYFYRAKIDNPSTSSDWIFTYSLKIHYDKYGYWDTNSSATQSTWVTNSSGNLITVVPGVYQASFNFGFIGGSMGSDPWLAGVLEDGGTLATGRSDGRLARAVTLAMQRMGQSGGNISIGGTTIYWQECSPQCVSRMVINRSKSASYKMYYRIMNTASTTTVYFTGRVEYILISPITTAI